MRRTLSVSQSIKLSFVSWLLGEYYTSLSQSTKVISYCVLNQLTAYTHLLFCLAVVNEGGMLKRIPRPRNAFMIFASEHRRQFHEMHPEVANGEISIK